MPSADFYIGQGDLASPIRDILRGSDGQPVGILDALVEFRMAPLGGGGGWSHVASNDQVGDGNLDGSRGAVSYQWRQGDTDEAGWYLGRWVLTYEDGTQQSFPNDGYLLISVSEDVSIELTVSRSYCQLEELKSTLELRGSFADNDIRTVLAAASRVIDGVCERRFYRDDESGSTRFFSPQLGSLAAIDDVIAVTSLAVDRAGDGAYEESWAAGDYVLEPLNANLDGRPFEQIRVRRPQGRRFSCAAGSLRVTGQFGWPTIPDAVKLATKILSARYLARMREAPFGIVTVGTEGALMRIARTDPDLQTILADYMRTPVVFVG